MAVDMMTEVVVVVVTVAVEEVEVVTVVAADMVAVSNGFVSCLLVGKCFMWISGYEV